jgi:hypothetical protein
MNMDGGELLSVKLPCIFNADCPQIRRPENTEGLDLYT